MSVEETNNNLQSLTGTITQATGSLTILQSVLRDTTRLLPVSELRELSRNYDTLTRTLTATSREAKILDSQVRELSKSTKHYSQVELSQLVSNFKQSTSVLSAYTKEHLKLVEVMTRTYGRAAPEFLDKLNQVSQSMTTVTARIKTGSQSLSTYYELLTKGGNEAVSAFEAASGRMNTAMKRNADSIDLLLTRVGVKLENFKTSVGQGLVGAGNILGGSTGVGGADALVNLLGLGSSVGGAVGIGALLRNTGFGRALGGFGTRFSTLGRLNLLSGRRIPGQTFAERGLFGLGQFGQLGQFGPPGRLGRFAQTTGGRIAGGLVGAVGFSAGLAAQEEFRAGGGGITGGAGARAAGQLGAIAGAGLMGGSLAGPMGALIGVIAEATRQIFSFTGSFVELGNVIRSLPGMGGGRKVDITAANEIIRQDREARKRRMFGGRAQMLIERQLTPGMSTFEEAGILAQSQLAKMRGRMEGLRATGPMQLTGEERKVFQREAALALNTALVQFETQRGIAGAELGAAQAQVQFAAQTGQLRGGGVAARRALGRGIGVIQQQIGALGAFDAQEPVQITQLRTKLLTDQNALINDRVNMVTVEQQIAERRLDVEQQQVQASIELTTMRGSFFQVQQQRQASAKIEEQRAGTIKEGLIGLENELKTVTDVKTQDALRMKIKEETARLTVQEAKVEDIKLQTLRQQVQVDNTRIDAAASLINLVNRGTPVARRVELSARHRALLGQLQAAPAGSPEAEALAAQEQLAEKAVTFFDIGERPALEREQVIGLRQQRLQALGDIGVTGRGSILEEQLKSERQRLEELERAAEKVGAKINEFQRDQIKNNIEVLQTQTEINKKFEQPLAHLDHQNKLLNTQLQIHQQLKLPPTSQLEIRKELLANAQEERRTLQDSLKDLLQREHTEDQVRRIKEKIAGKELEIAQQLDFQRRTFAEMFTEQMLNMPSGSFLNPAMASGFALQGGALGTTFQTGMTQTGQLRRGTFQSQIGGIFGEGFNERTPAEKFFERLFDKTIDVRITNPEEIPNPMATGAAGG